MKRLLGLTAVLSVLGLMSFTLMGCPAKNSPSSPNPTPTPTPSWKLVGNAGFYPSAIASLSLQVYNNTPYVAFQDTTSNKVSAMTYSSGSWVTVGTATFTTAGSGNPSIAIDNGTPYVAYQDSGTSPSYEASAVSLTTGGTWTFVGSEGFTSNNIGNSSQLTFSPVGVPYFVYQDPHSTPANELTVMDYNGGSWSLAGSADFSPNASAPSLFFYSNQPCVVYSDQSNSGKLSAMTYNGTSWSQLGAAAFSSIVNSNGNAVVSGSTAYAGYAGFSSGFLVYTYNGTSWSQLGSTFTNGGNPSSYLSLAVNGSTPYVAFQDGANGNKVSVMSYSGSSWNYVGPAGFSSGTALYTRMGLINGNPCVAFYDGANGGKPTVMEYH